jgi:type IV pilus assembly protein PilA
VVSLNGEFPLNKIALININTKITGTFGDITGAANTTANTSSGDIVYKFKTMGVNESLKGKSVWYNRTVAGIWECRTDLNATLAPKMCSPNFAAPTGT